jgi:hypothetical protein
MKSPTNCCFNQSNATKQQITNTNRTISLSPELSHFINNDFTLSQIDFLKQPETDQKPVSPGKNELFAPNYGKLTVPKTRFFRKNGFM